MVDNFKVIRYIDQLYQAVIDRGMEWHTPKVEYIDDKVEIMWDEDFKMTLIPPSIRARSRPVKPIFKDYSKVRISDFCEEYRKHYN